jgi:hypothetical protein
MIPLASNSAYPFREQKSEGRPLGFRQYAKLAFSIKPLLFCRHYYSGVSTRDIYVVHG